MNTEIAKGLKTLKQRNGLTIKGLAKAVGCTQPFITQLKMAKRPIPPMIAIKIDIATQGIIPVEQMNPALAALLSEYISNIDSRTESKITKIEVNDNKETFTNAAP